MESFLEVSPDRANVTDRPVESITITEGETRIVGIRKPAPPYNLALIGSDDPSVAGTFMVRRLGEGKAQIRENKEEFDVIINHCQLVEQRGCVFVQIIGIKAGTTALIAPNGARPATSDPYAAPVEIRVTPNPRKLYLPPGPSFSELWRNHPYQGGNRQEPCNQKLVGGCMVRFCKVLRQCGIDLRPLHRMRAPRCKGGRGHEEHFVNPYDFETWQGQHSAYVFGPKDNRATPPLQPEPMPGIAALSYMRHAWKGVVLFWDYWPRGPKDMHGGHIDFYNGEDIGNNLAFGTEPRTQIDTNFLRARKIVFWPLEAR